MQKKIKFVFDVLRYEQVVPKQFIKHIEISFVVSMKDNSLSYSTAFRKRAGKLRHVKLKH